MRTVTALQLRAKLGQILDKASAGERILVERDHKPLAMLVSYEEGMSLVEERGERIKRALAALDKLKRLGEEMAKIHPGPFDAVKTIREDRNRDDPR